ncbi:MAG: homoprotocatechuate degradation operon regulator HpaR [Granulosicoccus sp.]
MRTKRTMKPVEPLPPTNESLPIVLLRAREVVMAPIRNMLLQSDVTEQQWRILRVLSEYGPMDASSVAERACLLVPSLTRIATNMRERGLITQAQAQNDRRRQTLSITAAGQRIIDENQSAAHEIVQKYKTRLGEKNYQQLLRLLAQLSQEK